MNSKITEKDRRQHERYDITSGGYALLKSSETELLGSIKDISAGGLSLSHIDDNEEMHKFSRISINLISEKSCYEHFTGENVWSRREEGSFTTATVKMKCCGVAFEKLNNEMRAQLNEFIDSLTKK